MAAIKFKLQTKETLRRDVARWLLRIDKHNICCEGNELGDMFLQSYVLPELEETLLETTVDESENITLIFESAIRLGARETVSGKTAVFTVLRYVRALYDDTGNIYKYVTMGYSY